MGQLPKEPTLLICSTLKHLLMERSCATFTLKFKFIVTKYFILKIDSTLFT